MFGMGTYELSLYNLKLILQLHPVHHLIATKLSRLTCALNELKYVTGFSSQTNYKRQVRA